MVSAPNISGTSVSMVLPPMDVSMSENTPMVGFAVMPDRPSEPPHLRPTTSWSAGQGTRLSARMFSASASMSAMAAACSSSTCWAISVRKRLASYSPMWGMIWSMPLFSQPRPSSSTPPALGWVHRFASAWRVFSWSPPIWEQP